MVASPKTRRVVCTIVRVPEFGGPLSKRFTSRPSDLVPWADPYIAGLVRRLQSEIRLERAASQSSDPTTAPIGPPKAKPSAAEAKTADAPLCELEPPCPAYDPDWQWEEEPRWSLDFEPGEDFEW